MPELTVNSPIAFVYTAPAEARQLAKLEQQEAAMIAHRIGGPLTCGERTEIAAGYAYRARLHTALSELAVSSDAAEKHRHDADTCLGARQLYLDSNRLETVLARTDQAGQGEWIDIHDTAAAICA